MMRITQTVAGRIGDYLDRLNGHGKIGNQTYVNKDADQCPHCPIAHACRYMLNTAEWDAIKGDFLMRDAVRILQITEAELLHVAKIADRHGADRGIKALKETLLVNAIVNDEASASRPTN